MSLPAEMLLSGLPAGGGNWNFTPPPLLLSGICGRICGSVEVSRNRFLPSSLQCTASIQLE